MRDDRALEIGVVETPAEDIDQVIILSLDTPGGANGIVIEFGGFRSSVPALDDAHKPARHVVWTVGAQPFALDEIAPNRDRPLLVLRREVVEPDPASHGLVFSYRLSVRMKGLAGLTDETPGSVRRPERHAFRLLGDGREGQHRPVVLR